MESESMKDRMDRLERVLTLQAQIIDRLTTAVKGHQMCIQTFAKILNIELEQQPAQLASRSN